MRHHNGPGQEAPEEEISDVEKLASEPDEGRAEEINRKVFDEMAATETAKKNRKAARSMAPKAKKAAKAKKSPKAKAAPKAKKTPKPKAPRSPKAPKAKKEKTGRFGRHSQTMADGTRRKPGTNPPMSEEAAKYGRKVAKARHAKGWTQRQLADKVGLTQPGVANIERGTTGGGKEATREKLAKVLGL